MLDSAIFLQNYYKQKAGQSLSRMDMIGNLSKENKTYLDMIYQVRANVIQKKVKSEELKQIQGILKVVEKHFETEGDVMSWLQQKTFEMFTWSDYSRAWFKLVKLTREEEDKDSNVQITICEEICYAYYYSHGVKQEEGIGEFLVHPPFDYTRPHGWHQHQYYVSVGEAIAAYLDIKDKNGQIENAAKILEIFSKQRKWFQYPPDNLEDFRIPYETYSTCFDEAQSPETIRPDSLEICFYFVQQEGLNIRHVLKEKKTNYVKNKSGAYPLLYYLAPCFLYYDLFDMVKFLNAWELFLKIYGNYATNKWLLEDFKKHCSYYVFTESKIKTGNIPVYTFCWLGKTKSSLGLHATYRDINYQALSFLGDLINVISFTMLVEAQLSNLTTGITCEWQLNLIRDWLEVYFSRRGWLKDQRLKKGTKDLRDPVWPTPCSDALYLIDGFSTPVELVQLSQELNIKAEHEPEKLVFYETQKTLSTILKKSDMGHLTNKSYPMYAVFALHAVKPQKQLLEIFQSKSDVVTFMQFKEKIAPEKDKEKNLIDDQKFNRESEALDKLLKQDTYFMANVYNELY